MSPRAAWRLEALGFERVHDYVGGKADWLAHGLPREGVRAGIPYAGDVLDADAPTCAPEAELAAIAVAVADSPYGFCLVLNDERVVVGRVRRSALRGAGEGATAESLMDAGPSTVRPNIPAAELTERLARKRLRTAIVTDPAGRLLGVFSRAAA